MRTYSWLPLMALFCVISVSYAEEKKPTQKITAAEIQKWIKQLGSDDFGDREDAEEDLKKAGTAVIVPLKKAMEEGDVEVTVRGKRILDSVGWSLVPDVTDLSAVFPSDAILLLQTKNLKVAVAKLRKESIAGKLYDGENFTPVKDVVADLVIAGNRMTDDAKKEVVTWLDRFGGPCGVCFLGFDSSQQYQREEVNLVLGINDPDPDKAFKEFIKRFPIRNWGNTAILKTKYRGISFSHATGDWNKSAKGKVKNLIVQASNKKSMQRNIDGVLGSKREMLKQNALYQEAMKAVGSDALASLYFNWTNLLKSSGKSISANDRKEMKALGFDAMKYAAVSMNVSKTGLIEERAFVKLDGVREGLGKLLALKPASDKLAALCPPDALTYLSLAFDGLTTYDTILKMTAKLDPRDTKQFEDAIKVMDKSLGYSVRQDIFGALKGDAGLWVLKPSGPDLKAVPEVQIVIETASAEAASKLADRLALLAKNLNKKPEDVKSTTYKKHKCYWLEIKSRNISFPLSICWSADGNRLLISSSQTGLQKFIGRTVTKRPGLDTSKDYKRLITEIPVDKRGGLIYANTSRLLSWGYSLGLPLLGSVFTDDNMKAAFQKAPKEVSSILKDFPGTLFSLSNNAKGLQAQSVGGMPVSGLVVSSPFVFMVQWKIRSTRRAEARAVKAKAQVANEKAKGDKKGDKEDAKGDNIVVVHEEVEVVEDSDEEVKEVKTEKKKK